MELQLQESVIHVIVSAKHQLHLLQITCDSYQQLCESQFLYVVSCELCSIRSSTLGTLGIFWNQRQAQRIGLVDFVGDVETVGVLSTVK